MKPAASLSNMSYHNIQALNRGKSTFSIFFLKGNSHQKISVANMIDDRATPEKFFGVSLAYVRSLKGSQRPVEVLSDVTEHLVAYWTAIETWTNSSRMHTHTGQHSWLPCMHTLSLLD